MRSNHARSAAAVLLAVVLVLGLALAGCASGEGGDMPKANEAGKSQDTSGDEETSQQPSADPGEEPMHVSEVKVSGDEVAVITTGKGVVEFTFYPKDAPNTVASFIELADKGFYDGLKFHRVVPGFVVQGGDPYSKTGEGPVGSGGPGYRLKAEFNSRKHTEGAVAMARAQDPDSAGSQFYITLSPQPSLDGQYTVFGQVTKGMDVVRQIQADDVIESVKIVRPGKQ